MVWSNFIHKSNLTGSNTLQNGFTLHQLQLINCVDLEVINIVSIVSMRN